MASTILSARIADPLTTEAYYGVLETAARLFLNFSSEKLKIAEYLISKLGSPKIVADLGAGNGIIAQSILEHVDSIENYYFLEPTKSYIHEAQFHISKRLLPKVRFVEESFRNGLTAIPYTKVDFAFASHSLPNFHPDPRVAIRRVLNKLNENGAFTSILTDSKGAYYEFYEFVYKEVQKYLNYKRPGIRYTDLCRDAFFEVSSTLRKRVEYSQLYTFFSFPIYNNDLRTHIAYLISFMFEIPWKSVDEAPSELIDSVHYYLKSQNYIKESRIEMPMCHQMLTIWK